MLIPILSLDGVAIRRGVACKRKIALIVAMSVPGRPVLPLSVRDIGTRRRQSSRAQIPASHSVDSVTSRSELRRGQAHAPGASSAVPKMERWAQLAEWCSAPVLALCWTRPLAAQE